MLTEFDRELLNLLQTELPLVRRPYAELAQRLASDEQIVLDRLIWLKQHGYIRHIGAFFDSAKLGYHGTLAAVKVSPGHTKTVARAINAYPGVTHNYEREGEYALWFTLLTADQAEQRRILEAIRQLPGVEKLVNLPATKKYKVNVTFKL